LNLYSVAAMRVSNEDCLPARIHGGNATPTPTVFAEIVSDDFPVLHLKGASERTAHCHGRYKGVPGEWHLYAIAQNT